jgi:hypothetical protein
MNGDQQVARPQLVPSDHRSKYVEGEIKNFPKTLLDGIVNDKAMSRLLVQSIIGRFTQ